MAMKTHDDPAECSVPMPRAPVAQLYPEFGGSRFNFQLDDIFHPLLASITCLKIMGNIVPSGCSANVLSSSVHSQASLVGVRHMKGPVLIQCAAKNAISFIG